MSEMDDILEDIGQSDDGKARRMPRLGIRRRLWLGFGLIAFSVLAWNIATLYFEATADAPAPVTALAAPAADNADATKARVDLERLGADLGGFLLSGTSDDRKRVEADIAGLSDTLQSLESDKQSALLASANKLAQLARQIVSLHDNARDNYPAREFIDNFISADNARMEADLKRLVDAAAASEDASPQRLARVHALKTAWAETIGAFYRLVSERDQAALQRFEKQAANFEAALATLTSDGENGSEEEKKLLADIARQQKNIIANIRDLAAIQMSDKWRTDAYLFRHKFAPLAATLRQSLAALPTPATTVATPIVAKPSPSHAISPYQRLALVTAVLALMAGLVWYLSRSVLAAIDQARIVAGNIANGKLDNHIDITSDDETGELLKAMASMQQKLKADIDARERDLRRFCRLKHALDHVSASLVITGKDHRIRYANHAAKKMFADAQEDFVDRIPGFDPAALPGMEIGAFHEDGANHLRQLATLTETLRLEMQVGERTFDYIASPVLSDGGERLGTVIEWIEKTANMRVERHISEVVNAARAGQLDRRLTMVCSNEFYSLLEEQLNALLGTNEQIIQDAIRVLGAVANGDLTQTITTQYEGDYLELKNNINGTVEKLRAIIGHIRHTAEISKQNAHEIRESNMELSVRTEQQSAAIEKTAASIEQITGIVRRNLENTQSVNALATEARDEAQDGEKVVTRTIDAMTAINEASQRISDVIHIIDEIAFQTNLLALNASVEAAHAGELGRGFAVVATEVRNLAQRSAEAAKEITALIEDSGRKVEEGSRLVDESGETLHQIIESIRKVSSIISEISAAGEAQASGIEQVNRAILEIDQATQQNTAMVEETAAASETLGKHADELERLVGYFRIPEEEMPQQDADSPFVERRKADRPWGDQSVVLFDDENDSPEAETAPPPAVNGGWQEF